MDSKNILIFFGMLFGHFVGDYLFQWKNMSNYKRQSFWKNKEPFSEYRYNFIGYLMMHGYVWAFCITFPMFLLIWNDTTGNQLILTYYVIAQFLNAFCHSLIDHLKANKKLFNDMTDQSLHMLQIFATWIGWIIVASV